MPYFYDDDDDDDGDDNDDDVYSYFEKGCRKKCTRQSQKVLWVVEFTFLHRNLKEWHLRPWTYVREC